ncbi:hypothetical protein LIER_27476 [Lithospermum erythrorhizon]|uniref:Uncharacterized protein n=1 Tax=Lithospermum erythrorhizon TaxID=34254 RepID=A0AAV3RC60_LITER
MRKRRKVVRKLMIDEQRTRVGNKRMPKNVEPVPIDDVAINEDEKKARWKFIFNRRIAAEKLSEVTKKNVEIMGILETANVMSTVETVGPYWQSCVLEAQHLEILTTEDEEAHVPGFITISPKLLQGIHVVDIPLRAVETGDTFGPCPKKVARFIRNEIKHLEEVIQFSLDRKSVLNASLRSITGVVHPNDNNSEATAS